MDNYINNKYLKWYNSIIQKARQRSIQIITPTESHHIIPKSFFKNKNGWLEGDPNNNNNIVMLTIREHFVCHLLLPKFTAGIAKNKTMYALWFMMCQNKFNNTKKINSKLFTILRERVVNDILKIKKLSAVTKEKIRKSRGNTPTRIGPHSAETKNKISVAMKGRLSPKLGIKMSDKIKQKMSITKKQSGARPPSRLGVLHSAATKIKISAALKGRKPWNTGKSYSADIKLKMSLAHKKRWALKKETWKTAI